MTNHPSNPTSNTPPNTTPTTAHTQRPRALITGGAKRVGRAIALELARQGCTVDITYRTSPDEARHTLHLIHQHTNDPAAPGRAWKLNLDDRQSIADFTAEYTASTPTLRALIHNASSYAPTPLRNHPSLDLELAHSFFWTHALGPLAITHALLPQLHADGHASIVAMGDLHALGQPRPGYAAYTMSKAALHELVRSLAVELAPHIRVNAIAPGVIAWPDAGPDADPALQAAYLSRVPLARPGTVLEAAHAVAFLALHATYTTGHILPIDGGRSLR